MAESVVPGECPICGSSFNEIGRLAATDLHLHTPGVHEIITCAVCRSGTTLPVVPEAEFGPFYRSSDNDDYSNYDRWQPSGLLVPMIRLAKFVHDAVKAGTLPFRRIIRRRGTALDVGCGGGEVALFMMRRGWKVVGIEPDSTTCEFAQSKGVDARVGTLDSAELEPESFDAVIFHHVLEHVGDPAGTLEAAQRLLRPGGALLVCVPNFASWQRIAFKSKWQALDLPRHRHHMTPIGLRQLAERLGYRVDAIGTGVSMSPFAVSIEYAVLGRRLATGGLTVRLIDLASLIFLMPANLLVSRLTRRGDVINLVAIKPS